MSAFRLTPRPNSDNEQHVATARAVTPMRRRGAAPEQNRFSEEQPLPSQRRSDLMAPKQVGFWALIPYMAATAVVMASM